MVKKIWLLTAIVVLAASCDRKLQDLKMEKTPYTGDELQIDGYYYSDVTGYDQYTGKSYIRVAVFYSDGFCIHTSMIAPEDLDETKNRIENDILLNDAYIAKIKEFPGHIGVFKILYSDITIEHWEDRTETVTRMGRIVDDETFIIDKMKSNRTGKSRFENLTYHFQEFSPLPDPTNKYTRTFD